MRLLTFIISIILLGTICSTASERTIQKKRIRYTEKIQANTPSFSNKGIPLKANRLSNKEGNIELIYDSTLPDSIQVSLLAAKKIWESKIQTVQPIVIPIVFESLGEETAMIADALCLEIPGLIGCPSALASQIVNYPYGSIDSPDGYIFFNSDIDWNCKFSNGASSEYNLPTMILRGIARCLGFGSNIIEDSENEFIYNFGWPTYFDKLLYCDNIALSDLRDGSPEMANFVRSGNVYAHTKSQKYKIYAPGIFDPYSSLCYFDDDNSIMSYSLGQGNTDISIDDKTCDVLRTIGWDLPLSGLNITCNNISDNGIGSSYEPHTFSLLKDNETVSEYNWSFSLKNKEGYYTQISSGTGEDFTIDKISSTDEFFININGDLEGKIECDYYSNGKLYSAIPFTLSLELKPMILSIDDISIVNAGPFSFYLNFNVRYAGADHVYVEIEEEYSTALLNDRFDEPYMAHVQTGNISNLYYSWVTVLVTNKYGSVCETMEYAPVYGENRSVSFTSDINNRVVREIVIYSVDGSLIYKGTPSELGNQQLNPGIYIKEEIFENGSSKSSKIYVR